MKVLDGHIHMSKAEDHEMDFADKVIKAGVTGGIILSPRPGNRDDPSSESSQSRLCAVSDFCGSHSGFYPFFWIDPISQSAPGDVEAAVEAGVSGFKVICSDFNPGDKRAMETYRLIASAGKPILFHSGILWDGRASSAYNRPAEFECLIDIDGLRFSLAHISWPWCDEHIAVYGKFLAARQSGAEMFVDTTPGTPRIYRREALTKVYTVGYDVGHNVFFGTDCSAPGYNSEWASEWIARDGSILRELEVGDGAISHYFAGNLERFVGISPENISRKGLRPGE